MKKLFAVLSVCAVLSCTFCSCSKDENSSEDNPMMLTVNTEQLDKSIIQPIFDYYDGFNNNDPDLVMDSFNPQSIIDQMKENGTYEEEIANTNNRIDLTHQMWTEKYGENSKLEFKEEIQNTHLTKEYLDLAKKYFEYTYYDMDIDFEIEDGYEYQFKYAITGDNSSEENNETTCIVKIKDDGWKLVFCSSEMLLSYMIDEDTTSEASENQENPTE